MTELSWLAGHLDESMLEAAESEAEHRLVYSALRVDRTPLIADDVQFIAEAIQLLADDSIRRSRTSPETRELCAQVFELLRTQIPEGNDIEARVTLLRTCCFGWLADQAPQAAKLLITREIPTVVPEEASWADRSTSTVVDAWLLLLRKRNWSDIDSLLEVIDSLRSQQSDYERRYLDLQQSRAHPAAWELVALYHLARAAEVTATFLTRGEFDGRFDVRQQIESHFDRAVDACDNARAIELSNLSSVLSYVAEQLIDNSLWTVARAAGPAAMEFVEAVVSRQRKIPIFEVLPPQRDALATAGLARSAQRAVVVSLPTSSGKTLIAQFRILQALSLFSRVRGWVAYVAPTRALVNQITARLRRDFGPMGIVVERVSPALEVDSLEAGILADRNDDSQFRVLVTTPEKLDLMLRSGWEAEIGRPLCLVVVDEAHNLSSSRRGLKLELLLATINRESRDAQFLLLTPFVPNADEIARWLDPSSNQSVELSVDWQPNDRVIGLAHRIRGKARGSFTVELETLSTTRDTLKIADHVQLGDSRPLGYSWSTAQSPNRMAAAIAHILEHRGATITLTQRPSFAWTVAGELLEGSAAGFSNDPVVGAAQRVVAHEYGDDFPLVRMLDHGIGVHHSGLSDEVRVLTEWLLENNHIKHLVSTTTVAQGVNFPVANVVFATHQYPYGEVIPPHDFWNIAGRAGRVDQGQVGVVAIACPDSERAQELRDFVNTSVLALNSTLVDMVRTVIRDYGQIDLRALSYKPEWSAFLQFLAHTYRQIGDHESFAAEVEQVLRGTLGFQSLRSTSFSWANQLIEAVREYAEGLSGKPLSLVDSTGFSWESVAATLGRLSEAQISPDTWADPIFGDDRRPLRDMVGVMLQVPELRESLIEAASDATDQSGYIANVVHDWVNGMSLAELASTYFSSGRGDSLGAITRCCQRIYGDIAPTVAWGLAALQSLSGGGEFANLSEAEQQRLRNLPAYAYYGVQTDQAVALRMLGVSRAAASPLAAVLTGGQREGTQESTSLRELRLQLRATTIDDWTAALGVRGIDYFRIWKILEGVV